MIVRIEPKNYKRDISDTDNEQNQDPKDEQVDEGLKI